MKFYFAPMEGITGYIYRNAHYKMFGGADKYFAPFISPTVEQGFTKKEKKEILPENNQNLPLVPQILTNHAQDFIFAAKQLQEYGYQEVNLNLGCPSGTVVSKGRGAGFLAMPEKLDRFLDEVFREVTVAVSVKTRLGKDSPEESRQLIQIYNQYPICELTIHPRTQKDLYRNKPNWDFFEELLEKSTNPVCYNGDIHTEQDYKQFCQRFPKVGRVMLGRGLLANPKLILNIKSGEQMTWREAVAFAQTLQQDYLQVMPEIPVLFKMKELWSYMGVCHPEAAKLWKKIKKSRKLSEYEQCLREFTRNCM